MVVDAVRNHDLPVIQAVALVYCVLVLGINALVDVAYLAVNRACGWRRHDRVVAPRRAAWRRCLASPRVVTGALLILMMAARWP